MRKKKNSFFFLFLIAEDTDNKRRGRGLKEFLLSCNYADFRGEEEAGETENKSLYIIIIMRLLTFGNVVFSSSKKKKIWFRTISLPDAKDKKKKKDIDIYVYSALLLEGV